jgi:hypothetical protein
MLETVPGDGRGFLDREGEKKGEDRPVRFLGITGADVGRLGVDVEEVDPSEDDSSLVLGILIMDSGEECSRAAPLLSSEEVPLVPQDWPSSPACG